MPFFRLQPFGSEPLTTLRRSDRPVKSPRLWNSAATGSSRKAFHLRSHVTDSDSVKVNYFPGGERNPGGSGAAGDGAKAAESSGIFTQGSINIPGKRSTHVCPKEQRHNR